MLRAVVVCIGAAFILGGVWLEFAVRAPWPAAVELAVFGVLILIGTFLEGQYRSRRSGGASWQTTGERFVDPTSGALTEVTYNPETGERSYETTESKRFPPI